MFLVNKLLEFDKQWVVTIGKANQWLVENRLIIERCKLVRRARPNKIINGPLNEALRVGIKTSLCPLINC
jgi:hypothetical protein